MFAPPRGAAVPVGRRMFRSTIPRTVALLLFAGTGQAEEIEPYRLTGIDGHVALQYVQDEQRADQPGTSSRSRQAQSGIRSEIFVMTHSYIYHPNLMTLDLGGGPILHGESFSGDSGEARARGMLYNFSARATLLRDKPYTGSLFFSHLNPTVSIAPGQVLTQENTRYGFDFSLLAAASPIPLQVGFVRSHSQGRGADRMVDDRNDQFNISASRSFGALGSTQVQYQTTRQASLSGSQDLPIQSSTASNQAINFDTRLQFGDNRQYDLANVISFNTQRYSLEAGSFPTLSDRRVMLDLRARHSDQLHSFGFYNYGHSSQGDLDAVTQAASAGLSYWPLPGLEGSLGLRGESSDTRQFAARSRGIDASVRYERPLPLGTAQLSYGVRYDSRGQQAVTPQASVIGERVTLSGAAQVALARPYVVAGTAVVTNAGRTQTFVSGLDYVLTAVGTETRLQRLIGGNILDGEQLLVDYAYDVGGTYAYSQLDQTLNFNWNPTRHVSTYLRYFTSAPRLASGSPSFPLNEVQSITSGLRADLPLQFGLPVSLGGGVEVETRKEMVSPYRRLAEDFYIQSEEPLFGLGYLRASTRRSRIEYSIAAQNSDLRGSELRFWSRQWFGMDLTAAVNAERDEAGALPRRRVDASIGLQWQKRRFSLSSSLVRTHETQSGIERDRTTFQFLARREL
jgi:hypothetical protein